MGRRRSIQVPMDRETPPRQGACGGFSWTYGYARSDEARAFGDTGQDCLALRCNGERLVFALCDGVSQSFFGDLAARFVAGALVEWLWTCDVVGRNTSDLPAIFHRMLGGLTESATGQVMRQPLPDSLPPLVREVLEWKRLLGSQTTFVCARLDLPGEPFPHGSLLAAGLGDTRLRLWGPGGELTAAFTEPTAGKWSTSSGVTAGSVTAFSTDLSGTVRQVTAYTDGLAALDAYREPPHAGVITSHMKPPLADDACFLTVMMMQGDEGQERVARART